MILYGLPISSYCAKLRVAAALKRLDLAWREPPGGSYRSPAYRAIVPTGTIPALVDGELVLSESDAIIEYLEECRPDPALLPSTAPERARVRMISRLHDLQFEPALRALFAHVAPANRVLSVVAERWNDAAAKLDVIEALLARDGGFAVGARPTMADCGFAVSFVVRDSLAACLAQRVTESPRICAWRMALDTHPQIAPVTDAYRRTLEAWIATRR